MVEGGNLPRSRDSDPGRFQPEPTLNQPVNRKWTPERVRCTSNRGGGLQVRSLWRLLPGTPEHPPPAARAGEGAHFA